MEIYFNVIEFGPGIYGIGRAARHYFGKTRQGAAAAGGGVVLVDPAQPEAALRAVLPHQRMLDAKWDAYIKRIMRRMHERGRLTDEEFATATATPLRFVRTEAMPERECMALVKRITTPPQQLAQSK